MKKFNAIFDGLINSLAFIAGFFICRHDAGLSVTKSLQGIF